MSVSGGLARCGPASPPSTRRPASWPCAAAPTASPTTWSPASTTSSRWYWRETLRHTVFLLLLLGTLAYSLATTSLATRFDVGSAYWALFFGILIGGFVRKSWFGVDVRVRLARRIGWAPDAAGSARPQWVAAACDASRAVTAPRQAGRTVGAALATVAAALLGLGPPARAEEAPKLGVAWPGGERIAVPARAGKPVRDPAASGGRALALRPKPRRSALVTVTTPTGLTVRARGARCRGAMRMVVTVSGQEALAVPVRGGYAQFSSEVRLAPGTHRLEISHLSRRVHVAAAEAVDRRDRPAGRVGPDAPRSAASAES